MKILDKLRQLLASIIARIKRNQEWKLELREIERQAFRSERKNYAAKIGKLKAQGKYKSPLMQFLEKQPKGKTKSPAGMFTGPMPFSDIPGKKKKKADPMFIDLNEF